MYYIYIYILCIYKDIRFIVTYKYKAVIIADKKQRNKINFLDESFSYLIFRV